jgi:alginate O-acetyltransferase complex protein AlgI
MLFNSLIFFIFIIIFFVGWPLARKYNNSRWVYIVFFSFVFYGWWDWRFLFLMIGNGLVNFICSLLIYKKPNFKKVFLAIALLFNLGILGIFKYSGFIAHELDGLLALLNISPFLFNGIPAFALILPAGISFYTFESMNYTIDVYRGKLQPSKNIFQFYAFLSMFPRLLAGPIIRAKDMLVQLNTYRIPTILEKWDAIKIIIFGFFQKVVLADNIAPMVNKAFDNDMDVNNPVYWWIIMIGFSLQILFDFSGYSLIARGLGKLMGYHFHINFNHPYLSVSLKEFWERWHISLSSWFRDYVYIPLGGSRKGKLRGHVNMWITMIVSGIWHGASFNFIIWGGIHAAMLSLERVTKWSHISKKHIILKWIGWGLVCFQVIIAWVFFRANNFSDAVKVLDNMFNVSGLVFTDLKLSTDSMFFMIIGILFEFVYFIRLQYSEINTIMRNSYVEAIIFAFLLLCCIFLCGPESEFIYFQF